ncbi:glycine-rich domain-containing protein [Sphingomonas canadensis]|uniref:Glycine-rich domain-containing protein n=1 Tax=Sphingomonas canadensis TaxID=1219257 RepID=A0ABW3H666_9SPHN|nr:hypothetical protein [Sphingomonas canadensis]MCW3835688.1 hypothetical protein [Sphingomonas canadensis]
MSEPAHPQASHRDHPVWALLSRYTIGPEDAALGFARRLARENGWSLDHAGRVIEEYKRFAFLAVTGTRDVTPSDPVDQAWHLHLTYSRDYWERFCPQVLGRALHHGPTLGGEGERHRHFAQYADTLKRYEAEFGPPPADIWPPAAHLLLEAPHLRRVDLRGRLIVPRSLAWAAVAAVALLAILLVSMIVLEAKG